MRMHLLYVLILLSITTQVFSRPPSLEYQDNENGTKLVYTLSEKRLSDISTSNDWYISQARLLIDQSNMTLQLSVWLQDQRTAPEGNTDSGISCEVIYPSIMKAMQALLNIDNTALDTISTETANTYQKAETGSIPTQNIYWSPMELVQTDSAILITCQGNYYQ